MKYALFGLRTCFARILKLRARRLKSQLHVIHWQSRNIQENASSNWGCDSGTGLLGMIGWLDSVDFSWLFDLVQGYLNNFLIFSHLCIGISAKLKWKWNIPKNMEGLSHNSKVYQPFFYFILFFKYIFENHSDAIYWGLVFSWTLFPSKTYKVWMYFCIVVCKSRFLSYS